MIESGIAKLVQGDTAVAAIAATGGYVAAVPKGTPRPTWRQTYVGDQTTYTLDRLEGPTRRRLQIDCFGGTQSEAVQLAAAIDAVLSGYRGTLPDSDQTVVQICKRTNLIDFEPDESSRTYRRLLEYAITFSLFKPQ